MNRIEWPILSHSDPIQFSQVTSRDSRVSGKPGQKIRVQSKSHFFSPEKSPEKSFVVILTTDHLIGWYLILPNRKVTPLFYRKVIFPTKKSPKS